MPEKGPCTDITCNNEIKELYECHCCLRLICLYHLNKHVEIRKENNKQRLDNLRNELNTVIYTLKQIVVLMFANDQHVNEEEEKRKRKPYRKIFGECPLTFNGAYGLTKANHSIEFSQRLVRAIVDDQDPRKTKLFDRNENVINHFYKVPCPFFYEQINSSEYTRQNIATVPCQLRLVTLHNFKQHLRLNHKISNLLAQKLVDSFKKSQAKNDTNLASLIPST
ncbi:unnamed protein product [Rotaria sp. Silwood1]|nr:unnamed protein product [Rotaria sp. Silwood1]CAF1669167.1 unnamed protein product [Rotaria sp. Silwood1]